MSLNWLFDIGSSYQVGIYAETYDSDDYAGVVDPESFSGVTLNRVKVELQSVTRSEITFDIIDNESTYDVANIEDEDIIVRLIEDGVQTESWRYHVETVTKAYSAITVTAVDYLSTLLDGVFPNTALIKDRFPEALLSDGVDENACLPVCFGTTCYIPLYSVADSGDVYYILGELDGNTFTVSKITSPHNIDGQIEYTAGVDITITQSTYDTDVRVFQPEIDAAAVFWRSGTQRVPPLVKYTDSAYSSYDNPVDILKFVLKSFGAVDDDFDASWGTTATAVDTRGYSYSRGFYTQMERKDVVLLLLAAADANIYFGEYISIELNSKTSADTIDSSMVVKYNITDVGTLEYNKTKPGKNDSGYILYTTAGVPQDKVLKIKTAANATVLNPVKSEFDLIGVSDSQSAQKLGTCLYQKKLQKIGTVSFTGHPDLIALHPGQVITVNDTLYGASVTALIDTMVIQCKDAAVKISAIIHSNALQDFEDISPGAITPSTDTASTGQISVLDSAKQYTENLWDGTDGSINFQAEIDNAIANGETLIQGGYINADLLYVTSGIIVGTLDWSTQIGGAGKPDDNADVTGSNTAADTSAVNGVASSTISGWRYAATTYIDGGDIYTGTITANSIAADTITLNKLKAADAGTVTFSGSTSMTFATGTDLILQSGADSTAMITFQNTQSGNKYFDFYPSGSGANLVLKPRQAGNILIGDGTYTSVVGLQGATSADLYCGTNYLKVNTTSILINLPSIGITMETGGIYSTTSGKACGTASYPWYGVTSTYGIFGGYSFDSNIRVAVKGSGSTASTYTVYCANSGDNVSFYVNDLRQTYTYILLSAYAYLTYGMFGGATYNSSTRVGIKGSGTGSSTYSIVTADSSDTIRFYIRDDGQTYGYGWNNISDKTLKDDIAYMSEEALPKIMQLKPAGFTIKADSEKQLRIGQIAQDVYDTIPGICTTPTEEFPFMGYSLDGLMAYHIKATQELYLRVQKLEETRNV